MALSVDELKLTMDTLDDNFDAAYAAAPDAASKQQLRQMLSAARDAYWKAVADGLTDGNDFVISISEELEAKNEELQQAATNLGDFAQFLTVARDAVKLAAAVAALAAAA